MRGRVITAVAASLALVFAFIGAIAVLNATSLTPAGFVSAYLDALSRRDAVTAIEMAGPPTSSGTLDDLLVSAAMVPLDSHRVTSVEPDGSDDRFVVTASYVAGGVAGVTQFRVERAGTYLGVFPLWRFTESPYARLNLTVDNARSFVAGGLALDVPAEGLRSTYLAFAPMRYEFGHDSSLLSADPVAVITDPGRTRAVRLSAQPNQQFVAQVQLQIDDLLQECTQQRVLMPTGCPFGFEVADRVLGEPTWTITEPPSAHLIPTSIEGEWLVPAASGVATLSVEVMSIFDGTVTQLTETVEFSASYLVSIMGADAVAVVPAP